MNTGRFENLDNYGPNLDNDINFVGRKQAEAAEKLREMLTSPHLSYFSLDLLKAHKSCLVLAVAPYSRLDLKLLDQIDQLQHSHPGNKPCLVILDDDLPAYQIICELFPPAPKFPHAPLPWAFEFQNGQCSSYTFSWNVRPSIQQLLARP